MPSQAARPTETSAVATTIRVCEKAYGPSAINQSAASTHSPKPIKSTKNAIADLPDRGNPTRNVRNTGRCGRLYYSLFSLDTVYLTGIALSAEPPQPGFGPNLLHKACCGKVELLSNRLFFQLIGGYLVALASTSSRASQVRSMSLGVRVGCTRNAKLVGPNNCAFISGTSGLNSSWSKAFSL